MILARDLIVVTPYGKVMELIEGFEPSESWHYLAPSERQVQLLCKFGVPVDLWLTRGEASHMLKKLSERVPPSEEQEAYLRKFNAWNPKLTYAEAKRKIKIMLS